MLLLLCSAAFVSDPCWRADRRGMPDFIEVKGVTYCGNNKASSLTIQVALWWSFV